MKIRTFAERLYQRVRDVDSCVCLGLDTDPAKIPATCKSEAPNDLSRIWASNKAYLHACHELVAAVKINAAFYEKFGPSGKNLLRETFTYCAALDPGIIKIIDYKRADIGNSNLGYVEEARWLGADAVTVNPLFGQEDGLQPFLDQEDLGVIILCRTSNKKGAPRNQDGMYTPPDAGDVRYAKFQPFPMPYYQFLAHDIAQHWNKRGNCAIVVGATAPEQMTAVRSIIGEMPILAPGYGSQGATAKDVSGGFLPNGDGLIVNNSRGAIFAYAEKKFLEAHPEFVGRPHAFADATRVAVTDMRDALNKYRRAA